MFYIRQEIWHNPVKTVKIEVERNCHVRSSNTQHHCWQAIHTLFVLLRTPDPLLYWSNHQMFKNIIYCNNPDRVTMYSRRQNLISKTIVISRLLTFISTTLACAFVWLFENIYKYRQQGPAEFDDKSKGSVKCEIHTLFTLKEPLLSWLLFHRHLSLKQSDI